MIFTYLIPKAVTKAARNKDKSNLFSSGRIVNGQNTTYVI